MRARMTRQPGEPRPGADHGRRGAHGRGDRGEDARLLRAPAVQQPGEPQGPLRDHRAGNLGDDGGEGGRPRRQHRNRGHGHRGREVPQGEEPCHQGDDMPGLMSIMCVLATTVD
jgi:hypothetical protein